VERVRTRWPDQPAAAGVLGLGWLGWADWLDFSPRANIK
jgi:hypothetical protein